MTKYLLCDCREHILPPAQNPDSPVKEAFPCKKECALLSFSRGTVTAPGRHNPHDIPARNDASHRVLLTLSVDESGQNHEPQNRYSTRSSHFHVLSRYVHDSAVKVEAPVTIRTTQVIRRPSFVLWDDSLDAKWLLLANRFRAETRNQSLPLAPLSRFPRLPTGLLALPATFDGGLQWIGSPSTNNDNTPVHAKALIAFARWWNLALEVERPQLFRNVFEVTRALVRGRPKPSCGSGSMSMLDSRLLSQH